MQLLITFVLTPPILCAAIYILKLASPYMPLYLWGFLFALQMVMLVLYPAVIAPLFNKYSPLPEGTLREAIEALAGQLAFPLRKLYVMDGSKRSGHANAYMYGFGRSKRIVLFDTLMEQCDEPQVWRACTTFHCGPPLPACSPHPTGMGRPAAHAARTHAYPSACLCSALLA